MKTCLHDPVLADEARYQDILCREEALTDMAERRIDAWDDREWHERIMALLEDDPDGPVFSSILRGGDALRLQTVQRWIYQRLLQAVEREILKEKGV